MDVVYLAKAFNSVPNNHLLANL